MDVLNVLDRNQRRNLVTLFAAGLLFWAGLACLLPTLPLYIQHIGGDAWVGWVMAFFALGLLLSKEPLAKMADQQSRKQVLLIGMSAVVLAPLGYLLLPNIPSLMLFRAIHGISIAAFATAYSALVVDLSPRHCRGELIGYMSLVNPLGMAIGPAVGGFLQESTGFSLAISLAIAIGGIGLICTTYVREPHQPQEQSPRPGSPRPKSNKFWSLLATPRIRVPAFVLMMIGLAFGTLSTFVPLYMMAERIDLNIGLFYTVAAVMNFVARFAIGRASDRYGRGVFITVSLVFYSAAMFVLWQAHTASSFLLGAILQGSGAGMVIPMMAALMADRAYPHERGQMFGLCMVGFDIGIAIAGPTMQPLALAIGYGGVFGVVTGLILVGLTIFLTCSSKDLSHSLQFALGKGQDIYAVD